MVLHIACALVMCYLFANAVCPPIISSIQKDFGASQESVQRVIFFYILGIGLSQTIYGILADLYGKKLSVLIGLSSFMAASVLLLFSSTIDVFLLSRFLQGFGAGCCSIISKSILADHFKQNRYIHATAIIMFASVLTQVMSPIISGVVTIFLPWKFIFIITSLFALILIIICTLVLPKVNTEKINNNPIILTYINILRKREFTINTTQSSIVLLCINLYYATSPFIIQKNLHLSNFEFSLTFLITDIPFALSCYLIYKKKQNSNFLLKKGFLFMLIGGLAMFISSFSFLPLLCYGHIISMAFFNFGTGFVFTISTARAVIVNKESPGVVSSLIGSLQMLSVALTAIFFTLIKLDQLSISLIFLLITFICLFVQKGQKNCTSVKSSPSR